MPENEKSQKSLDEKTAALWLNNTGQKTENNTEKVTGNNTGEYPEHNTDTQFPIQKDEKYTERFELKMTPSQMEKLKKMSDEYNKSRAEIMRKAFEFMISKL